MPKEVVFRAVKFPCPSCGEMVSLSHPDDNPKPVIIHPIPTCKRFDDLDSQDEWIAYVADANRQSAHKLN